MKNVQIVRSVKAHQKHLQEVVDHLEWEKKSAESMVESMQNDGVVVSYAKLVKDLAEAGQIDGTDYEGLHIRLQRQICSCDMHSREQFRVLTEFFRNRGFEPEKLVELWNQEHAAANNGQISLHTDGFSLIVNCVKIPVLLEATL